MTLDEFRDYVEKEGVDGGDESIVRALIDVAKAAKEMCEDRRAIQVNGSSNMRLALAALDKELER